MRCNESNSFVCDICWFKLNETKTNVNTASRVLVEACCINGNGGTAGLWTQSWRQFVDYWILVVLKSTVRVTNLAAAIKGDVDIEPSTLTSINNVTLLIHQTGSVAVDEG
jgi:hypothetical protein